MLLALEEDPNVELVVSYNSNLAKEGGLKVMENAIQAYPDIVELYAINDKKLLAD